MGVLKDLTDEYFKKKSRIENGKIVEFYGNDILIPVNYKDIFDFFTSFNTSVFDFKMKSDKTFDSHDYWIKIEGGEKSVANLYIKCYKDIIKYSTLDIAITEKMYDSFVEFLKKLMKDSTIIHNGKEFKIVIITKEETENLFKECGIPYKKEYVKEILKEYLNTLSIEYNGDLVSLLKEYVVHPISLIYQYEYKNEFIKNFYKLKEKHKQ